VITVSARPEILWPPNGKLVTVRASGTITDEPDGSGVQAGSAAYRVMDEYGRSSRAGALLQERTAGMPSPWRCRPRAGAMIRMAGTIRSP
jgi:hypothetical protein